MQNPVMTIFADDLHPGQQILLGHYTVTESEIIEYARQWDPVFIHTDPATAHDTPLGGVVASGLHTMAIYQRLAVHAFWSQFTGGIGRGFQLHFRRPVWPGTTLTGDLTVHTVTPRPERGDAAVTIAAQLVDDDREIVLQLTNDSVLPLRAGTTTPSTSP